MLLCASLSPICMPWRILNRMVDRGKRVLVDLEDRMLWKETKSVEFSVKSLYGALETRNAAPFPWRASFGTLVCLPK
ncbi:hypothetical protein CK203_096142 [Vitis vinifera]|uniref:Uncharacterized protein n=1 Tax=Vitis vinifera TaxID=29760 RepID=A0A438DV68_VITVI|nr:hypothetical protein CK203_096142 [Vitis vinifera]